MSLNSKLNNLLSFLTTRLSLFDPALSPSEQCALLASQYRSLHGDLNLHEEPLSHTAMSDLVLSEGDLPMLRGALLASTSLEELFDTLLRFVHVHRERGVLRHLDHALQRMDIDRTQYRWLCVHVEHPSTRHVGGAILGAVQAYELEHDYDELVSSLRRIYDMYTSEEAEAALQRERTIERAVAYRAADLDGVLARTDAEVSRIHDEQKEAADRKRKLVESWYSGDSASLFGESESGEKRVLPEARRQVERARHEELATEIDSSMSMEEARWLHVEREEKEGTTGGKPIPSSNPLPTSLKPVLTESDMKFTWKVTGTVWQFENVDSLQYHSRVYGFDLDSTLIETRSGRAKAHDYTDWQLMENVKDRLRRLYSENAMIVIFTNQGGIEKGHVDGQKWRHKVQAIAVELGVPLLVLAAPSYDWNRKPRLGMWQHFLKEAQRHGLVDGRIEFTYVGDAAGREADEKNKKDFSASDYKFALNINIAHPQEKAIRFETPEQFFDGSDPRPPVLRGFDAQAYINSADRQAEADAYERAEQELTKHISVGSSTHRCILVVMCGAPASGKSRLSASLQSLLRDANGKPTVLVNRDTLKTMAKCVEACRGALMRGDNVVVDNTNPSPDNRYRFLSIAPIDYASVYCIGVEVRTPLDVCRHFNELRGNLGGERVPAVAYHVFRKAYQPIGDEEGFDAHLSLVPPLKFQSDRARKLFSLYAPEK